MKQHTLVIYPDGNLRCLWTDLIDLREIGTLDVTRASNVEYDNEKQGWTVTFPPEPEEYDNPSWLARSTHRDEAERIWYRSDAPLSAAVFLSRDTALAAEVAFLEARL